MNKYLVLLVLFGILFIGCSEHSSINSPVEETKSGDINWSKFKQPEWLTLPAPASFGVERIFSVSKSIIGSRGYKWSWSTSYTATTGKVSITSYLVVDINAFSGTVTFTQTHNDSSCVTTFGPSMTFLKPLTFTITYKGINLTSYDPADIAFAYLNWDGKVMFAANDGITVDKVNKILKVTNAKIPHFSRYGFIRKSTSVVMDPSGS